MAGQFPKDEEGAMAELVFEHLYGDRDTAELLAKALGRIIDHGCHVEPCADLWSVTHDPYPDEPE